MTKFIKLTEPYNNGDRPLIINCDAIRSIKIGDKGRDTLINMTYDNEQEGKFSKFYFVKESVEEIWEMLNSENSYIKQPIIMNAVEYQAYTNAGKRLDNGH